MVGELSGIGGAACWAAASIAMKLLATKVNAAVLNGLRCAVSLLFFLAVLAWVRRFGELATLPLAAAGLVILSGFIGVGLADVTYIWSLKLIGAARAMPISDTYPLITLILAVFLLAEPITPRLVAGTVLVVGGVVLLALPADVGPSGWTGFLTGANRLGLLAAALTACGWAISATALKLGLANLDVLMCNVLRLATSSASLLAIAAVAEPKSLDLRHFDRRTWAILLLITVLGTFATLGFVVAVDLAGAAKASALSASAPVFGLPLAFVTGERLAPRVIMGTILTVIGIWLLVS